MVGETWRHIRRGTVYEIITAHAGLQCSAAPNFENDFADDYWVVYRNVKTGCYFVRPYDEFMDGRFERIADAGSVK